MKILFYLFYLFVSNTCVTVKQEPSSIETETVDRPSIQLSKNSKRKFYLPLQVKIWHSHSSHGLMHCLVFLLHVTGFETRKSKCFFGL